MSDGPQSLDFALYYARLGWQVFPLHSIRDVDQCTCGNSGCTSKGKHPLTHDGFKSATDDEGQIRAWWAAHPHANIGIATGSVSNMWVLDIDKRDGGCETWASLVAQHDPHDTCAQRTGSGGAHRIYVWDSMLEVRNRTNVVPGIDVRGDGGYIVAPPSLHLSGERYEWTCDPSTLEPQPAPSWLLELVVGDAPSDAAARAPRSPNSAGSPGPRGFDPRAFVGALPLGEIKTIRNALGYIDPDCDRDTWIRVGMALHSTGAAEQVFVVWNEWSANATAKYPGEHELRRQWASFARKREEVRIASIFHYAIANQWPGTVEENADGTVTASMLVSSQNGHDVDASVTLAAPATPTSQPLDMWGKPEWIWSKKVGAPFPYSTAYPESLWWMREWVNSLAYCFQLPIEFPAAMSLALAAGALGNRWSVRVPRVHWVEHAALWFVAAAPSGAGKSIVFKPLIAPFLEHEKLLKEGEALDAWTAKLRFADIVLAQTTKDATRKANAAASDQQLAADLQERLMQATTARRVILEARPQSGRLLISDTTSEAFVRWLQEHNGCALVADPEGGVFDHVLGTASNTRAARLDPWLKAYNAEPIFENRMGDARDPTTRERLVDQPLVSIAVATQTKALAALFANEMAGARGFLARFCAVVVPHQLPDEFLREAELPHDIAERWRSTIQRILRQPRPSEPIEILLSEPAREAFVAWGGGELTKARQDEEGVTDYLTEWNGKLRGKALRIALALHCLAHDHPGATAIGVDTMQAALSWLPFLKAHNALLSHELRADRDLQVAERLLAWIDRGGSEEPGKATDTFTRRAAFRALGGSNSVSVKVADDVNGALAALVDGLWIKPVGKLEPKRAGPPAARAYVVHPRFHEHYEACLRESRIRNLVQI